MIWQVVVKSILLCIVWQTNSGLFDVFLSLSQIDGVLRFYALHTRVFHKCPAHSFFRFLVKATKKWKNQLSYLFIFCIKNQHFAWKCQLIFLVTDQKTRNEKWNEPNKNCIKCLDTAFKARNVILHYFYSLFLVSLPPNNGSIYLHLCSFMIPASLFYEVNAPLLQVCYKP